MKVYIGPDSLVKRKHIFELILAGGVATVITPEQSTLAYESQMIDWLDLPGMIDVQVTSLNHLLSRLSRDIFTPQLEPIGEIGKKMLYRDILDELSSELRIFRDIDQAGFYEELEATIDRLMRDQVGPEALLELRDEHTPDSMVYNKLADLHLIYQRFNERISGEYFSQEESLRLFEDQGHRFRLYSPKTVWLLDFKHLDARSLRMLKAIDQHTSEVCLALAYEPDKPWIYQLTHDTLELLRANFSNLKVIDITSPMTPLRELAENLLALDPQPVKAPFRAFAAEDPYEEVEFIGLDILQKLRQDETLKLDDIRLIAADLDSYEFTIKSVFGRLGLPVFSDERKSIVQNRIVKSILALMNVYLEGYRRDDVISFLKGYLSEDSWDELDAFENYLIENGINFKRFRQPLNDPDMEQLRQQFLGPVLAREDRFKTARPIGQLCDELRELLILLHYPERIEQTARQHEARGETEDMLIITQVWNSLVEALAQLKKVAGDKVVRFRQFKRYFDSAIKDLSVGIIPPAEGRITLATLHRSTHKPCRVLYFCGMAEGVIPRDYLDTGLLKHQEKYRLREFGYRYFDTPEFNENLDLLDQFIALSMVQDELIFSYAGGNYSSEVVTPSVYLNRAIGLTGAGWERGLKYHYQEHGEIAYRYAVEAVREGRREAIDQVTPDDLMAIEEELMRPVVTPPIDRADYPATASASRLEKFRSCPYSYFVAYDLKPYVRREYVVEHFDIGDLYHELLQKALEAHQAGQMDRHTIAAFVDQAMAELLAQERFARFLHTAADRYFIDRAKRVANFVLGLLIDQIERSEFVPTYFEKSIQVGLDRFELRGKIDRIDIKDNRFTVIDYKTGSKTFDLNSIYQGIDLQLTLYADAFKSEQAMEPAGLFYFNIRDPIVDQSKDREKERRLSGITAGDTSGLDTGGEVPFLPAEHVSGEIMTKLTRRVRRMSQDYVRRIKQGEITIKPIRTSYLACDYCEYSAICRFDKMRRGFSEDRIEKLKKPEIYERLEEETD